jgi:hypothetical protein
MTFFLLPPRPLVGDHLMQLVGSWLPGLDWRADTGAILADLIGATAEEQGRACVLFREDLPDDLSVESALRDGFGAEPGDRVVEVRFTLRMGEANVRTWAIGEALAVG